MSVGTAAGSSIHAPPEAHLRCHPGHGGEGQVVQPDWKASCSDHETLVGVLCQGRQGRSDPVQQSGGAPESCVRPVVEAKRLQGEEGCPVLDVGCGPALLPLLLLVVRLLVVFDHQQRAEGGRGKAEAQ